MFKRLGRSAMALLGVSVLAMLIHGCSAAVRPPPGCPGKDCHAAAEDGDIGRACCTEHTSSGTWQLTSANTPHPRHCCIAN